MLLMLGDPMRPTLTNPITIVPVSRCVWFARTLRIVLKVSLRSREDQPVYLGRDSIP